MTPARRRLCSRMVAKLAAIPRSVRLSIFQTGPRSARTRKLPDMRSQAAFPGGFPMNRVELQRLLRTIGRLPLPVTLFVVVLISALAIADGPIASSSFIGAENPLSENGTWVSLTAFSPYGTVFQK